MSLHGFRQSGFAGRLCARLAAWGADRRHDLAVWADLRAFPPLAVWAGVQCVAVLLILRRFSPSASLKLTANQITLTATAVALLMVAVRALLARVEPRAPATWLRSALAITSAAPIVTLFFASVRRPPLGAAAYLGAASFAAGATAWLWNRDFMERLAASFFIAPCNPLVTPPPALPGTAERPNAENAAPSDLRETLRLSRKLSDDGGDRLEGMISAEFAAGQGATTFHLSFQPAFPRTPEFVCAIDEKNSVRVKGTAVYPYGCRVELKRTGDLSLPARFEIRFSATLKASLRPAA